MKTLNFNYGKKAESKIYNLPNWVCLLLLLLAFGQVAAQSTETDSATKAKAARDFYRKTRLVCDSIDFATDTVSLKRLKNQKTLKLKFANGEDKSAVCRIINYTFIMLPKNGAVKVTNTNTDDMNFFTPLLESYKLVAGDFIMFTDITILTPVGKVHLDNISTILKE